MHHYYKCQGVDSVFRYQDIKSSEIKTLDKISFTLEDSLSINGLTEQTNTITFIKSYDTRDIIMTNHSIYDFFYTSMSKFQPPRKSYDTFSISMEFANTNIISVCKHGVMISKKYERINDESFSTMRRRRPSGFIRFEEMIHILLRHINIIRYGEGDEFNKRKFNIVLINGDTTPNAMYIAKEYYKCIIDKYSGIVIIGVKKESDYYETK